MIDPQADAMNKAMNAGPPLDQVGLEQARQWIAERTPVADTEVAKVANLNTGGENGVDVRLYHPSPADELPLIVFSHGGGWILGTVDSADETCRRLALASRCAVISVEYRLAPEFPYPAALEDVIAVLGWLPQAAGEHHLDVSRVGVAGESSGAQVALSVALAARNLAARNTVPVALRGQLLVCPPLDRRMKTGSWDALGHDYVPRRSQMAWMWDLYLGENDQYLGAAPDPYRAQLADLPPTVIVVAEYDPLRDEALVLAERLRQAGVEVDVIDCRGQIHPVISYAPVIPACASYLTQASESLAALLTR
jgi:acetyl esterase